MKALTSDLQLPMQCVLVNGSTATISERKGDGFLRGTYTNEKGGLEYVTWREHNLQGLDDAVSVRVLVFLDSVVPLEEYLINKANERFKEEQEKQAPPPPPPSVEEVVEEVAAEESVDDEPKGDPLLKLWREQATAKLEQAKNAKPKRVRKPAKKATPK